MPLLLEHNVAEPTKHRLLLKILIYRTCAIITRGFFEVHLCTVTFGLMYGQYSRAVIYQEQVIVARVRQSNRFLIGSRDLTQYISQLFSHTQMNSSPIKKLFDYIKFFSKNLCFLGSATPCSKSEGKLENIQLLILFT